jgi:hypothetical protein
MRASQEMKNLMPLLKNILIVTLAIPMGVFALVAGEADDSPGLQGLGLLLLLYVFIRSSAQWLQMRTKILKKD